MCALRVPQTLGNVQEKGTVENNTYPDVCRDGHRVGLIPKLASHMSMVEEIYGEPDKAFIYIYYVL